jgi:hypothetical protein
MTEENAYFSDLGKFSGEGSINEFSLCHGYADGIAAGLESTAGHINYSKYGCTSFDGICCTDMNEEDWLRGSIRFLSIGISSWNSGHPCELMLSGYET